MLMNSQRSLDLMDPMAREFSLLRKKRQKTDEDALLISQYEFELAIYWDEKVGAYWPSFNIIRCIQDGAKMSKNGKTVIQGLRSDPRHTKFPVLYPGREGMTVKKLSNTPGYRDIRTVGVSGKAVTRTRPRFNEWSLMAHFLIDRDILDVPQLQDYVDKAGLYIGIGDFRIGTDKGGQYGAFSGTVLPGEGQ